MKNLEKHDLSFDRTFNYFKDQLTYGNTLSTELLRLIDFSKGNFFTLLPNDANLKGCYEFKSGGILPQPPTQWHYIDGRKASYSFIPTVQEEVSHYILEQANELELTCIFEDVSSSKRSLYLEYFYKRSIIHFYQDETYFILNKIKLELNSISKCLETANSIWHSLCILSNTDCSMFKEDLSIEEIDNLCTNSKLIIVGAYDGEGYVFWERSNDNR